MKSDIARPDRIRQEENQFMRHQEYQGIKTEIIEISKLRMQLAIVFLTIASTLIGVVYKSLGSSGSLNSSTIDMLSLGLSIVFILFTIFIEQLRCHLRRLSTYLYVFFEEKGISEDYKFETLWKCFRGNKVTWSYSAPIALLMTIGSSIALIALWLATPFEFNIIKMEALIITMIGAIILWHSIYIEKLCIKILKGKHVKYEDKLIKKWENVKRISKIKRYVFLDRDGVINLNKKDHVKNLNEFIFLPNAVKSIVKLSQNDIGIVVISNQPIIGEKKAKKSDVENIHEYMKNAIETASGNIDAIYYCPDKEDNKKSKCRKPNIGMFEKAKRELGIDFSKSFLIGDQITDIQAGKTIGCFTILVQTGLGEMWIKRKKEWPVNPDRIVSGIAEATNLIIDMLKNEKE